MPTDIETALAATDLDARVPRLVAAVVRWVPGGAALPTWTSLEEGATSLALPADAAATARERLRQEPVQRALYALESLDAGADVVSVLGGLGASLRLYLQKQHDGNRGGIAALDRRQREDAATKLYTLAWCTGLLFGGPAATQLDALRAVPAGRALLAWVGAIELLLPFTQELGDAALRPLIEGERAAARERFVRAYGEEAAVLADTSWEAFLDAALELGSAGTMIVGGITGVVGKYLPTVISAVDFSGAVTAGAFDALPVYHLLGARLVAEAALVGPAKVPELPPVLDAPAVPTVEGAPVAEEPVTAGADTRAAASGGIGAAPTYPPEADTEKAPYDDLEAARTFAGAIGAEPTFTAEPDGVEPRPAHERVAEATFSSELTGERPAFLVGDLTPPDDDVEPSSLGGFAAAVGVAAAGAATAAAFASPPPPPPVRTVQPEDAGSAEDDGPVLRPLRPGPYPEVSPPDPEPPKGVDTPPLRTFVPTPTAPPEPVAKPAPPPLPEPVAKPAPPPLPPVAKPAPPPLPPVAKPAPPPLPEPVAKPAPPPLPPVAKPAPPPLPEAVAKPAPPPLPPVAKPAPPPVPAKPVAPPVAPPKPVTAAPAPKPTPAPTARPVAPPAPAKKSGGGWLLTVGGLLFLGLGCAGVGGGALAYAGYTGMIDLSALGIGSSKSSAPSTPTTTPSRPSRPGGKPGGRR